jgi:hypothetical protein
VVTGDATLYYYNSSSSSWDIVCSADVQKDDVGQYFALNAFDPSFQTSWKVVWSDLTVSIQNIVVSGTITQLRRPAAPSPRASLVMYPENLVPSVVQTPSGVETTPTYCDLAYISVDDSFEVTEIVDLRNITHRDFKPIADWLTKPWDDNLISLYEQVKGFATLWLSPVSLMEQEYANLVEYDVILTNSTTLGQ